MKDRIDFPPDLRGFLSQSYNLKTVADYDVGSEAEVAPERAAAAVKEAIRFVAYISERLAQPTA